jgi:hypothetical protein
MLYVAHQTTCSSNCPLNLLPVISRIRHDNLTRFPYSYWFTFSWQRIC